MAVYTLTPNRASLVILSALVGMGNPLACLIALALLGSTPVTTETVAIATKQDPRSAKRGLRCLETMGFALNVPYGQSDGWLIAVQAFQSPLLLDLMLTAQNAVSSSPAAAEVAELTTKNVVRPLLTTKNVVSSPRVRVSINNINDSNSGSDPEELRAAYLKVLAAGPVFPNIRKALANQLVASGPDYLAHLLAHLARCKSGRYTAEGYDKPGVYLKDQAETLGEVPDDELPPEGLTFAEALQWAMAGGITQAQLAEQESAYRAALAQAEQQRAQAEAEDAAEELARLAEQADERTRFATDPLYRLWQTALAQLRLETTVEVYRTWLADTTLATDSDGHYVVLTPNAYTRDWLAHRLAGTIKRTLASAGGDDRPLRFEIRRKDS